MKAGVDVALALRFRVIFLQRLAQAFALLLHAERHHQRIAAEGGRTRGALEIVRHHDARRARLRDMHVAVDAAGQHQQPRSVDRLRGFTKIFAERGDAAVLDSDVAADGAALRRDRSVLDQDIELRHRLTRSASARSARTKLYDNRRIGGERRGRLR